MIDSNILFSVLLNKGVAAELFFDSNIQYYAPETLILELETYKKYLLKKTHRTTAEYYVTLEKILRRIIVLSNNSDFLLHAQKFSPDIDDILFLALALQLNVPLWSNDKTLKEQKIVSVYATHDLLRMP